MGGELLVRKGRSEGGWWRVVATVDVKRGRVAFGRLFSAEYTGHIGDRCARARQASRLLCKCF